MQGARPFGNRLLQFFHRFLIYDTRVTKAGSRCKLACKRILGLMTRPDRSIKAGWQSRDMRLSAKSQEADASLLAGGFSAWWPAKKLRKPFSDSRSSFLLMVIEYLQIVHSIASQYFLHFFIRMQVFLHNLNILLQLLLHGLRADRPVPEPAARLHPDIQ